MRKSVNQKQLKLQKAAEAMAMPGERVGRRGEGCGVEGVAANWEWVGTLKN